MGHDWLYNRIVHGLEEGPKPALFEECAVDFLLYRRYNAVLIPGGSDGGKDAVVADGQGEPYPVFVTTGDVRANLRKNLPSYTKNGVKRRKYIIVTSKQVNDQEREKIKRLASEQGLTECEHIFGRNEIVSWLRHDSPYWRNALLGIKNVASALSHIPQSGRRYPRGSLLQREKDLQWLNQANSNRLVVGEPGAGKTSLLRELVEQTGRTALFVVERNRDRLKDAVLQQAPKTLLLDDRFNDQEFLVEMLHFQQEMGHRFKLIVTSWPHMRQRIETVFGFEPSEILSLSRLPTNVIEEIVVDAGIYNNYLLMRDIERQSDGLPGVAVWLARLALQSGGADRILSSEALFEFIEFSFAGLSEINTLSVSASIALGGDSGMPQDLVRSALQLRPLELRQALQSLDGGGMIVGASASSGHLKVKLPDLRPVLISKAFFLTEIPLSGSVLEHLIFNSPDPESTAFELVKASDCGAPVPSDLIAQVLDTFDNSGINPLKSAWLRDDQARREIPRLLSNAMGDDRQLHSAPNHPLRLLHDWIKSEYRSTTEALRRRAVILQCAQEWLRNGNDRVVGYRASLFALIPIVEAFEPTEDNGHQLRWIHGYLPAQALQDIARFWKEIMECVQCFTPPNWDDFLDVIGEWAYPDVSPAEETSQAMTEFSQQMALDVAEAASDYNGVLHRLKALMKLSYPDLEIITDEVVNILYPILDSDADFEGQQISWEHNVNRLAGKWPRRKPPEIAAELERIEKDMEYGRGGLYRFTPLLCNLLADAAESPLDWFNAFAKTSLPADTIDPFLRTAIERGLDGWETALKLCYEEERLRSSAVEISLTIEHLPAGFKSRALSHVAQFRGLIEFLARFNRIPQSTILDLLSHTDMQVAGKVAIALWQNNSRGEIPEELRDLWEKAIVQHDDDDYWLEIILSTETNLGRRWLLYKFEDETCRPFMFEKSIATVAANLNTNERETFLGLIPDRFGWDDTISLLVGDSQELFVTLLSSNRDEYNKLCPLSRPSIDVTWIEFAKRAIEQGHSVEEIVSHAFERHIIYSGKYSEILKNRCDQFNAYRNDTDEDVLKIAEYGYQYYLDQFKKEKKREDDEDVFGRD